MKIALIAEHLGPPSRPDGDTCPGDPAADVLSLARALAARDQRVTVYSRRDSAGLPRRAVLCRGAAVEYLTAGPQERLPDDELPAHIPAFADQLAERWRRSAPGVLHAHRWTSGLAALAGARDLGIPVVQTFRSLGGWPPGDPGQPGDPGAPDSSAAARIRLEAAIGRTAHAVLAGTSAERSDLARLGVPPASVWVVPPGVDITRFRPAGPVAAGGGRPRLLMAAPLDERPALAAAARALADVPDAELVIIGGPAADQLGGDPGYQALTELARRLAVPDRLTCAGPLSQAGLAALMRSADALVHVTTSESFATVPLQAMACGLPVIATDAGISQDAVIHGVNGFLVPSAEPALLAARIRQLFRSPILREGFGIAAASRAADRYSWERISAETLAVYEALAGRRIEPAA